MTNTPSANREFDDYNFDDATPSPNYNPGTPGGSGESSGRYESPSGAPYTPATPGSVYNPQEGYSPYHPSPTGASPSPNSYVLTPSPGQAYQVCEKFLIIEFYTFVAQDTFCDEFVLKFIIVYSIVIRKPSSKSGNI